MLAVYHEVKYPYSSLLCTVIHKFSIYCLVRELKAVVKYEITLKKK